MKKLSKLAVILTALALNLALTACSHPNSGDDSSGSSSNSGGTQATYLDGEYYARNVSGANTYTISLYDDGTVIYTFWHTTHSTEYTGSYTVNGNTLSGSCTHETETLNISGTKIDDTSWTVTVESYTFSTVTKQED